MKRSHSLLTFLFAAILITACHCNDRARLKGSLITLDTAIDLRKNYVTCPNQLYHVPQAFMYETIEFEALFQMGGIDKIRLYPGINTHNDPASDTLTLIMVPVNASNNKDNLTGDIFDFAEICPNDCNAQGVYPAPSEKALNLQIPNNWCVSQEIINQVIAAGEAQVGEGNVYGIRFYRYNNQNNVMDLALRPTTNTGASIQDIGNISFKGVTTICIDNQGCCDPQSALYKSPRK